MVMTRQPRCPRLFLCALPVSQRLETITQTIKANQVVIIAGETGSGKTTQLPKMCLNIGRGIYGTIDTPSRGEWRREQWRGLAEELGVPLGETVGFEVRFGDQTRDTTLIKVMTDGILLAETQSDRFLEQYDTLIIDEARAKSEHRLFAGLYQGYCQRPT